MDMKPISVQTDEGGVDGRLFLPEGDGPWPLVVSYMDAGGLRPAMTELAGPLVRAGYAVVQPDLYWRLGAYAPFDCRTVFTDPAERKRLFEMIRAVRPDQAMRDTQLLVDAVAADSRIRADRFGCVGYCLGGRMAFIAAAELAPRVAAAASIHGGGLVTDAPDSPHLGAPRMRAALYLGVADNDASCSPEHQQALRQALDAAGVRYTLELFSGALHGFAVPDFAVYDAGAAERQWQRVLQLFAETLRDAPV
jgi:carboxymethylenebutenolidase